MVAITFRTTGAWGVGAGSNLTPTQVDTNFYNLKTAVEAIEASPPEAVSIDSISQTGNQLTVTLTDATTQGPFTLPYVPMNFSGEWVASTAYVVGDIVSAEGALYAVIYDHTSELTFDPGANNGSGADYYQLMLAPALPVGGTTGQVLAKATGTDYDVAWADAVTAGGTTGQVLTKLSNADGDVGWVDVPGDGSGSGGGGAGEFIGCMLKLTSNMLSASGSPVEWAAADIESAATWKAGSGPYRLKAAEACIVEISYVVELTGLTSDANIDVYASLYSGTINKGVLPRDRVSTPSAFGFITGSAILDVASGSEFELFCETSSGNLNVIATGSRFTIRKLGASI